MKSNKLSNTIVEAIQDKKGSRICVVDLSGIPTAPVSEFIICQGKTPSQTSAIAESVTDKALSDCKRKPAKIDGARNGQWVAIDFGEIMVHVFTPDTREFYNLEDLWSDGKLTPIPDID